VAAKKPNHSLALPCRQALERAWRCRIPAESGAGLLGLNLQESTIFNGYPVGFPSNQIIGYDILMETMI